MPTSNDTLAFFIFYKQQIVIFF